MIKNIQQLLEQDLHNKRILVRFDLNVPLDEQGHVYEAGVDRIRRAYPTLNALRDAGAQVIILAHRGRDPHESLAPVAHYMNIPLRPLFERPDTSQEYPVVMLENLRSDSREESNDLSFAKELASYADYYVNDAFSVSHRAHASVVGIPQFLPSYAGFQFQEEVTHLTEALHPEAPSLLIMGGAKFETKLPVIQALLPLVDHIFIGGALANNFLKERGYEVGTSLLDPMAQLGLLIHHEKIILPERVLVQNDHERNLEGVGKSIKDVSPADRIIDVVIPENLQEKIAKARMIIWNGPMGNYENGFIQGTTQLANLLAASMAHTLVGGGDSITLLEQLHLTEKMTFISTAGGAMLDFLAEGTLPGIQALDTSL
jgi:phosphoglycerate kinase